MNDPELLATALIERWGLSPQGMPMRTASSLIVSVTRGGEPGMLKIATDPEEVIGMQTLAWWQGRGAVRVLEQAPNAILMERPCGSRSLVEMAASGQDDAATGILCQAVATLHDREQIAIPSGLFTLERWFRALLAPDHDNELLRAGRSIATRLLSNQREVRVLHGDIHHENVLDGGSRGWLAIDPKGLHGDRAFDYVNILRNPLTPLPLDPVRFRSQSRIISESAGIDRTRLLEWTFAFCCLSAAWFIEDDTEPVRDLAIARMAADELERELPAR